MGRGGASGIEAFRKRAMDLDAMPPARPRLHSLRRGNGGKFERHLEALAAARPTLAAREARSQRRPSAPRARRAIASAQPANSRKVVRRLRIAQRLALLEHLHEKFRGRLGLLALDHRDAAEGEKRLRTPDRIAHDPPRFVHFHRPRERLPSLRRARPHVTVGVEGHGRQLAMLLLGRDQLSTSKARARLERAANGSITATENESCRSRSRLFQVGVHENLKPCCMSVWLPTERPYRFR